MSHIVEGFFRPVVKPVKSATINKRRELSASYPKLITYRRHAEYDVIVIPYSFNKGLIGKFLGARSFQLLQNLS